MNPKSKALHKVKGEKKPNIFRSLIRGTEGKYSGYKHHPDYKAGEDIRKKPSK